MTVYHYQGRNAQGQAVTGQLEAQSAEAAAGELSARGLIPLALSERRPQQSLEERWQRWRNSGRVSTTDLILFCRQMYTITRAGVPLIRGIRGMAATLKQVTFKEALEDVVERLETGQELSAAMRHHPRIFDNLFVSIVSVGENSGRLEDAFNQLSEYLERDMETRQRIKAALRYPSFVLLAMAIAIAVVNVWVIPAFAGMFAQFGADLPLPTRILLAVSGFFVNFWHVVLVLVAGVAVAWRQYLKTEAGALYWGRKRLGLPIVGDIIERASMARYARSFSLMMRSGLPLISTLELCARAIDNAWLAQKIRGIRAATERGESLYRTHSNSGMFTPLVLQMIAVGEESGQVDELMAEVAGFYEREVDYDIKRLSDRIEPVIIIILAGFVLVMALGIFLPMWDMYSIQQ
ncbi:type II secretion system F family protein [Marinimicrobium alkaliphilum]|uniref:type II secretion system F family protein n=1 Tax=Marinimicrobium alkaliphilum TaxID=2202654 RepID=UPI000DB938EE|nr:type II secretion system F family protein [Marinimicrobium alkaliphilum]